MPTKRSLLISTTYGDTLVLFTLRIFIYFVDKEVLSFLIFMTLVTLWDGTTTSAYKNEEY
jgi:hypothetical protein